MLTCTMLGGPLVFSLLTCKLHAITKILYIKSVPDAKGFYFESLAIAEYCSNLKGKIGQDLCYQRFHNAVRCTIRLTVKLDWELAASFLPLSTSAPFLHFLWWYKQNVNKNKLLKNAKAFCTALSSFTQVFSKFLFNSYYKYVF